MKPLFKIGDYVKVLPRTSESGWYRCGFVDDMAKLEGQVFQVIECHEHGSRQHFNIPDDGYVYTLGGSGGWNWSSGMLEMYKHEEPKEEKATFSVGDMVEILPREGAPYEYTSSYLTSMDVYVGSYATITSVKRVSYHSSTKKDDGCAYRLSIDDGKWAWSSAALKKCSVKTQVCEEPSTEKHSPFFHRRECEKEITEVLEPKSKDKARYKLNFNI